MSIDCDYQRWEESRKAKPAKLKESGLSFRPKLTRLSEVEPKPIDWLWSDRFAIGKYSLVSGDPGLGKSFLTVDMAARISTGREWPDQSPNIAGGVVFLTAEDDLEDTVVPRLNAAGANLSRIVAIQSVIGSDGNREFERSVSLSTDISIIEEAIREVGDCRAVFIDPVSAYVGDRDSHKDADIRGMLAPLAEMASRHRVAVIGVAHLNKNSGSSAMYRTSGSLAFTAAARSAWVIVRDRDNPTGRRRLMLPTKNNLAGDNSGLAYELRTNFNTHNQPVLAWEPDPITMSADEALAPPDPPKKPTKTDAAIEWLTERLAGGESVASEDLEREATERGFKSGTVMRARQCLNVQSEKIDGKWFASLPD